MKTGLIRGDIKVKMREFMELLRSLELDGSVEQVKPIDKVHVPKKYRNGMHGDEDGSGAGKRRNVEWERMEEKDKRLIKDAAKADKKKLERKMAKEAERKKRERAERKGKKYVPDKKKKKGVSLG
jgi:hypothetical protein